MRKFKMIIALMLCVLILTSCAGKESKKAETTGSSANGETQPVATDESGAEIPQESVSQPGETDEPDESVGTSDPQSSESENTEDTTVVGTTQQTVPTQPEEEKPYYEEYLAALTVVALSMEYPDFVIQGVYCTSKVDTANKASSSGIYAVFESGGQKLIVQVLPLEAERSNEPMTIDLYAAEIGYASFELVDTMPEKLVELDQQVYAPLLSSMTTPSVLMH